MTSTVTEPKDKEPAPMGAGSEETYRPTKSESGGPGFELFNAVENCIEEFSSLDPDGSAFRYPMRLSGESTIPQDWIVINLRHLGEIMTKLGNLLDDSSEALFIRWEQEEEVRDEW